MKRALKTAESLRAVQLGKRELQFTLRRSNRRRTIGLTVDHRGVRVSAPWYATWPDIQRLIAGSERWLLQQLEHWNAQSARRWVDGERVPVLGRDVTLAVEPSLLASEVWLDGKRLRVFVADDDPTRVRETVVRWYRHTAEQHLPERVATLAPMLDVHPALITISDARSQWGSATARGRISLNWRLMQARPAVIDYVVAHELAHLRHMDHSPRFWQTVASVCPDYARLRAELRSNDMAYRGL